MPNQDQQVIVSLSREKAERIQEASEASAKPPYSEDLFWLFALELRDALQQPPSEVGLEIDAEEFAEARKDPKTRELLERADRYAESLKRREALSTSDRERLWEQFLDQVEERLNGMIERQTLNSRDCGPVIPVTSLEYALEALRDDALAGASDTKEDG